MFYDSLDLMDIDCDWTMGSIWQNDTVYFVCDFMQSSEMTAYPALRGSRNIGTFAGKESDMPTGVNLRHDYRPD